ncbi:MAG: flagellar switch protein FliM [Rhodobacterales bacterium]|nr:MAG: flagellar switch protein FliM [Rhodobacterales bacterium]
MLDQDNISVMRRLAGAGRPPPEIAALTAEKALRGAVAQAGEDVAALVVSAGTVARGRMTLARLPEEMPENGLLALLEGPEGRFGLLVLDPQALAALIEMQTMGRVLPRPAPPRVPTRTDAIMCADFIDRVLELLEGRVTEAALPDAPALTGFRYALALPDLRAVQLTLEDIPFRHFAAPLDLANGAKTGHLHLILPAELAAKPRAAAEDPERRAAYQQRMMRVEAQLTAVLHRVTLPLAAVNRLEIGAQLDIPQEAIRQITLEDCHQNPVAKGRLGQAHGFQALRINPPDPPLAAVAPPTETAKLAHSPEIPAMIPDPTEAPPGPDEAP